MAESQPSQKEPPAPASPTLAEAIIVGSVVLAGVLIFAIVATTKVDWFFPTLGYVLIVFVVWQRFITGNGGDDENDHGTDGSSPLTPNSPADQVDETIDQSRGLSKSIKVSELTKLKHPKGN